MSEEYEAETRLEEARRLHDEHTRMLCEAHEAAIATARRTALRAERDRVVAENELARLRIAHAQVVAERDALREDAGSLCDRLLSGDTGCIEESIRAALDMKRERGL